MCCGGMKWWCTSMRFPVAGLTAGACANAPLAGAMAAAAMPLRNCRRGMQQPQAAARLSAAGTTGPGSAKGIIAFSPPIRLFDTLIGFAERDKSSILRCIS
jgi:hypothetical protein